MNKNTLYLVHSRNSAARLFLPLVVLMGFIIVRVAAASDVGRLASTHGAWLAYAHIALAILTSAFFVAALMLACTLGLQTRRLHDVNGSTSFLDRLPAVLTLEQLLFRVLSIGFGLLTILVISGMFFGEALWGRALAFNHKVVFTLLAWLVFAVLLVGRRIYGWRGRTAVRATIFGFVLLFLAYAGTHFVLNVLLKR